MRYAGIVYNDFAAAPGVCLTFYTQGCPHKCKGCHNPETWDFNSGKEFTQNTMDSIIKGLTANGIHRTLSIQGGEPLHPFNQQLIWKILSTVKDKLPNTKIYLWTGYTYKELKNFAHSNIVLRSILRLVDVLIDGPYIEEERDITLPMRGSHNQEIIYLKED